MSHSRTKYTADSGVVVDRKSTYVPLDTLSLDYSISAVRNNLVLFCKSCKSLKAADPTKQNDDNEISYSGLLGIISKGIFQIYQLDIKSIAEGISYNLVQTLQPPNDNPLVRTAIIAAKWIRLRKRGKKKNVLVVISNVGMSIYSEDGSRPLCTVEYPEALAELVCRNISATESQILIGNGRGEIHIFDFNDEKIEFRKLTSIQSECISEMCCRRSILVTGSASGTLRVWKIKDHKAIKRCSFKTPKGDECVTGLGIWKSCVVATYSSGVFRIFHLAKRQLVARVMAHCRWIVSMDLLAHSGLLITVAEDDAVLTWKLRNENNNKTAANNATKSKLKNQKMKRYHQKVHVDLDSTIQTENMLLVGGKFLSCNGSVIALANYGAKELYFYSRLQNQTPDSC